MGIGLHLPVMILRFKDPSMTKRFVSLCKQEGYHGVIKKVDGWERVTIDFPDNKSKNKLISKWAYLSCEFPVQAGKRSAAFKMNRPKYGRTVGSR